PDGAGEFEILAAELTETPRQHQTIARLQIRALTGMAAGKEFERVTFFNRQESVNYLGGEMMALGIDSRCWSDKGRPLSQHIRETFAKLPGMRFKGSKTTTTNNGQTYHNLYINSLVAGSAPNAPLSIASATSPEGIPF